MTDSNSQEVYVEAYLARLRERAVADFEWLKNMWHREMALASVLFRCSRLGMSPPVWAVNEATTALSGLLLEGVHGRGKRGRSGSLRGRYARDMIDAVRAKEVETVRSRQKKLQDERKFLLSFAKPDLSVKKALEENTMMLDWTERNWERVFECVSLALEKTPSRGGPDAIKKSYLKYLKNTRDPAQPYRYHVFPTDFLNSIGLPSDGYWRSEPQGTIFVPYYHRAARPTHWHPKLLRQSKEHANGRGKASHGAHARQRGRQLSSDQPFDDEQMAEKQ